MLKKKILRAKERESRGGAGGGRARILSRPHTLHTAQSRARLYDYNLNQNQESDA